jgi:hypothetical protein
VQLQCAESFKTRGAFANLLLREIPPSGIRRSGGWCCRWAAPWSRPTGSARAELTSPECRQLHPMQIQQRAFFGRIAIGCAGYYNRYSQLRLVQAAPERISHHDALKSPRQRV